MQWEDYKLKLTVIVSSVTLSLLFQGGRVLGGMSAKEGAARLDKNFCTQVPLSQCRRAVGDGPLVWSTSACLVRCIGARLCHAVRSVSAKFLFPMSSSYTFPSSLQ